jgi:protein required for attachment to host cells
MATTWILVANSSKAKLYANDGPKKGLKLVQELSHPQSRAKGLALITDRPGHYKSARSARGAFAQQTDPREQEKIRFAHELAIVLEKGRTGKAGYRRLILCAPPDFLGTLNSVLGDQVRGLVSAAISKDYTKIADKPLAGHLGEFIRL